MFERVLTGETIRQDAVRLKSGGVVTYWDVTLAPIIEDGKVTGILNVTVDATERVRAQQNLERRVEERTHELSTLLKVSQDISSTLELSTLLDLVLDQLKAVVDYTGASILILEGDELSVCAYRGPIAKDKALGLRFSLEEAALNRQVIQQREPLYVLPDKKRGLIEPGALLPLRVRGKALGVLVIIGPEGGRFRPEQLALFESIANHLGMSVENARLYDQAEKTAVAAERSRLARGLHDAVTQTLFSSSLIAEVLPRLWERDPDEGRLRLEELRQLTRGALAEMRTLLLELRPAALADAETRELFRHLREAFSGRTRIPIDLHIEGDQPLPADVKVAIYRIAQEALNNIAKHAAASRVTLTLVCQAEQVRLTVQDDGMGFDPQQVSPEHLGLGIMKERAEAIGAKLTIESQPGQGTHIALTWNRVPEIT